MANPDKRAPVAPSNLLEYCVSDLVAKIQGLSLSPANSAKASSNQFREGLFDELLWISLERGLEQSEHITPAFIEALKSSESLTEILEKLNIEISVNPFLATVFVKNLIAVYVQKCLEFGVEPDPSLLELLNF